MTPIEQILEELNKELNALFNDCISLCLQQIRGEITEATRQEKIAELDFLGKTYIAGSMHLVAEAAKREGVIEGLKRAKLCVPEEDDGIHPITGMPQYKPFNKGITVGWNDARNETFNTIDSAIAELRLSNKEENV